MPHCSEFRFVLKKNASLPFSNVLGSLMRQSICESIILSPYSKEMQKSGLSVKPVKKQSVMHLKKRNLYRTNFSAHPTTESDSTKMARTISEAHDIDVKIRNSLKAKSMANGHFYATTTNLKSPSLNKKRATVAVKSNKFYFLSN